MTTLEWVVIGVGLWLAVVIVVLLCFVSAVRADRQAEKDAERHAWHARAMSRDV